MSSAPLRIVVLLDSLEVPAWIYWALSDVERSGARIVLALENGEPPRRRAGRAFRAYEAIDRRRFAGPRDHAELMDVSPLLEGCPRHTVSAAAIGAYFVVAPKDLELIADAQPDVILKLGFPRLEGTLPHTARLGVWSFDHLESECYGRPAFFWELARRSPLTETCLRATTSRGSRVLERSFAATDPASLHRGRNSALWKTSAFLGRALARVEANTDANGEWLPVPPAQAPAPALELDAPPFDAPSRAPGPLELGRFIVSTALRVLLERWRMRRRDFLWFVALRPAKGSWLGAGLGDFQPIEPPLDLFQADPFLVHDNDRTWLFVEEADQRVRQGWIRCSEILPDGSVGESRVVLERDDHVSYPFVFRQGDAWYMLPETSQSKTIELWRAVEFPWRWSLDTVLFKDVAAVDSTLLEHAGRFWLFTAMSPTGGALTDELFLFSADSLRGEWTPHPANPIVSDARRARPAGRIFLEDGRLYRPAQDCSAEYGAGIWIHRIDVLDPQHYRETPVKRIDPGWWPGARCTHTLDRAGGFEVIDARCFVPHGRAVAD